MNNATGDAGGVAVVLPTRRFTGADQQLFATLSGDSNPMHLDEDAARLTPAGAPVVHGVHIVLWALEVLAAGGCELGALAVLQVKFSKFAFLDQDISLEFGRAKHGSMKIEVISNGLVLASLILTTGLRANSDDRPRGKATILPMPTTPLQPTAEKMRDLHGWLEPAAPLLAVAATFPHLTRALGAERVRALALLSPLVGMVCPGLHSVFSGFTAQVVEIGTPRPGIEVWTRTVDSRFRLVSMGFAGSGLRGEVSAFHRFPPIEASLTGIAAIVDPAEFVGRKALVVGGSRGLGAVTAKLIVAGGGHAVITYARGARQAKSICEELTSRYGAGRCSAVQFEVGVTLESTLLGTSQPYTHIYYFASPRIFRQATDVFSASDFTAFTRVYIEGFYRLIAALPPRPNGLSVFYPSSIYVEKRPKQMTDYAMAKAAGEILCEDLRRAFPGVTIRAPRLPRILTDQTAVVPPVQAADAVEVMLPLLRAEVAVA